MILQVIGIHVDRVGIIDEFYEIRPRLVVHPVDVDNAWVTRIEGSGFWQDVVDLITHVHIPLGLDVFIEFRGRVVNYVHIKVNLLKIAQRIASTNHSSLYPNEGLIVCLHRNCRIRAQWTRF